MKIFTTIAIVAIVIAGAWYFLAPDSMKFWQDQTATVLDATDNNSGPDESMQDRITAKHQYKAGKHIVAGVVNLPTACYVLTTSARVAESSPEQVTIDFVANTSGDICIQVITSERFKVEFQASAQAQIKATWNGVPVELNLIEVSASEDLEEFELFIKA
ncbi:MAG: hypothetical protein WAX80_01725 [Minisyncoccia bacterium]